MYKRQVGGLFQVVQLRPPRIARRLLGLDTVLQGDPQGDFPGASSARPPVNGNALDPLVDPFLGVILPQGLTAGKAFLSGTEAVCQRAE